MKKYIKYIKFFIAITLFFFGSLFQYIPIFLFKIDVNNISYLNKTLLSMFSNTVVFIILVAIYWKDIITGIKKLKDNNWKPLKIGFDYWFIGLMIMVLSNVVISLIKGGGTSTNEESIKTVLLAFPYLTIPYIAIISPCIEELVFRKAFKDIFKNKWAYILTSGLIFGSLHVFLSPVSSFIDYFYLIPYCSMGLAFAFMCYETDNIIVPISMHVLHNTLNIVSTLLLAGAIIW